MIATLSLRMVGHQVQTERWIGTPLEMESISTVLYIGTIPRDEEFVVVTTYLHHHHHLHPLSTTTSISLMLLTTTIAVIPTAIVTIALPYYLISHDVMYIQYNLHQLIAWVSGCSGIGRGPEVNCRPARRASGGRAMWTSTWVSEQK